MTRNRTVRLALAAVVALLALPAPAQALNVYAATSLATAFPQVTSAVAYSFGGSNTLQLQIERGAPADVFASASPDEAQALFREGRCTRPVTFATNTLVLLVPKSNPAGIRSVYSLRAGGLRLAIGNAAVPIGAYTRKLLARLRLSSVLQRNTVSQESNVGGVVAKVALASADAGFTYLTDGRAAADRTRSIALPRWAQPPVRYQICAVKRPGADTSGAQNFISRITTRAGRAVLKRNGFGLPPRG